MHTDVRVLGVKYISEIFIHPKGKQGFSSNASPGLPAYHKMFKQLFSTHLYFLVEICLQSFYLAMQWNAPLTELLHHMSEYICYKTQIFWLFLVHVLCRGNHMISNAIWNK